MYAYDYGKTLKINEMNQYILSIGDYINTLDKQRLQDYITKWNFYEGYHWEDIPIADKPQLTKNYCRAFVNKFVAFEFSKGFSIRVPFEDDNDEATDAPITDFLNEVWDIHNDKLITMTELGQTKSVVGTAWLQVRYEAPGTFNDPFGEFPNGKIKLINMSSLTVFPEYDDHDKNKLTKVVIMYPVTEQEQSLVRRTPRIKTKVYRIVWTENEFLVELGGEIIQQGVNPYGFIPFVPVINYPLGNSTEGAGDIDDLIPLNIELNIKDSDISEIIDYHASPVTIVYGADLDSLERGADKMWGGLPKEARVENLNMNTDLSASLNYVADVKKAIHEVGNVPENSLGDIGAISNTSGVALQIMNMPLLERTNIKRMYSQKAIEKINKMIIFMGIFHGMIPYPADNRSNKELFTTEAVFKDPLPKDTLIELQQMETEMRLGLESRQGAMTRLGKDVTKVNEGINKDYEEHPEFYGHDNKLNSGMMNGETSQEMKRKEMTGKNKKEEGVTE